MNFRVFQAMTQQVLKHPENMEWSLQGLGMLRCYLTDDRALRLHIWDDRYQTDRVSPLHDHPWDFESIIVSGALINVKYLKVPNDYSTGLMYQHTKIICGPGGGQVAKTNQARLRCIEKRVFEAGTSYSQQKHEIHETIPERGTVSVITKCDQRNDEANIYWKEGEWVSAEPEPASQSIVNDIIEYALKRFGV